MQQIIYIQFNVTTRVLANNCLLVPFCTSCWLFAVVEDIMTTLLVSTILFYYFHWCWVFLSYLQFNYLPVVLYSSILHQHNLFVH